VILTSNNGNGRSLDLRSVIQLASRRNGKIRPWADFNPLMTEINQHCIQIFSSYLSDTTAPHQKDKSMNIVEGTVDVYCIIRNALLHLADTVKSFYWLNVHIRVLTTIL